MTGSAIANIHMNHLAAIPTICFDMILLCILGLPVMLVGLNRDLLFNFIKGTPSRFGTLFKNSCKIHDYQIPKYHQKVNKAHKTKAGPLLPF